MFLCGSWEQENFHKHLVPTSLLRCFCVVLRNTIICTAYMWVRQTISFLALQGLRYLDLEVYTWDLPLVPANATLLPKTPTFRPILYNNAKIHFRNKIRICDHPYPLQKTGLRTCWSSVDSRHCAYSGLLTSRLNDGKWYWHWKQNPMGKASFSVNADCLSWFMQWVSLWWHRLSPERSAGISGKVSEKASV